jgi:hypothetical protein
MLSRSAQKRGDATFRYDSRRDDQHPTEMSRRMAQARDDEGDDV